MGRHRRRCGPARTDKHRPFIDEVPSIRIRPADCDDVEQPPGDRTRHVVVDGRAALQADWCDHASAHIWAKHGYYGRVDGQGTAHGEWQRPDAQGLQRTDRQERLVPVDPSHSWVSSSGTIVTANGRVATNGSAAETSATST